MPFFQYQDDITELNEIAKHRPRSHLVIGIAQENRQIRELQQVSMRQPLYKLQTIYLTTMY